MDLGLRGKSVLVTGGSRGIGRAAAEAFAAAGCTLHLAARSAEDLQRAGDELRSSYQVPVTTHPGDLRNLGGVMALAKVCHDVDILVNNARRNPDRTDRERHRCRLARKASTSRSSQP